VAENNEPQLKGFVQTCRQWLDDHGWQSGRATQIAIALEEAATNALFHGSLELDSETREEDRKKYRSLVTARLQQRPYCNRRITWKVAICNSQAQFVICDEGPGFDPTSLADPTAPENIEQPSGRGLLLMHTFFTRVQFNQEGNEVTLTAHN